ncbi:STAS domain-containing protein [Streptacidiphilus sp. PB12-B1b]|uniref:STAS domain-containing protein n=1 Tax=Streptacidiphilus sp. PB12-B1b TaxID=2705012 RepID=UPI0015F96C4A|nr:STAS domain-containing protein [Streptacidiphilus sp. PB12-B1b]QMU79168.1 STAS domain-containing protein [Streptacidiphilus sp. PB12-B1b]
MDVDVNSTATGERCRIVSPHGELDLANAVAFRSTLEGADAADPGWDVPRVIVDLTAVTFMDVSPLRELRAAQARAHRLGGWVRLVHDQPGIDRLLRGTGLIQAFPRYATHADARTNTPARNRP